MNPSKTLLQELIIAGLKQSNLFNPELENQIHKLNITQLETVLILVDKALRAEAKMTTAQKKIFYEKLKQFFGAKKRIYQKTEHAFTVRAETKFENQEAVIEDLLIAQINQSS